MPEKNTVTTVAAGGAAYVGDRAELLAQVALARFPGLNVHPSKADFGYDLLVATPEGKCFLVIVKGFSSIKLRINAVETIQELRWRIDRGVLEWASSCPNSVYLFLIDADTGHGRYLQLNNVPIRRASEKLQTIRLPAENTIDEAGMKNLLARL
jgi:hypothetical protein